MAAWNRLACAVAMLLASTAASAQTGPASGARPERPYRGLFGSSAGDWSQSLVASLTLGAGYDADLLAEATGQITSGRPVSGSFGSASAGLGYQFQKSVFNLSASYGTAARYYPSLSGDFVVAHNAALTAGATFSLSPSTTLSLSQEVTYHPYGTQPSFSSNRSISPAPDLDFALTAEALAFGSAVTVAHRLGSRATLSAGFNSRWRRSEQMGNYLDRGVQAMFTYAIAKGLSWYAGYGVGDVEYEYGDTKTDYRTQGGNFGVSFNRQISISRRTTLSFSTGMTGIASDNGSYYTAVGGLTLSRELGRTWMTSVGYSRGLSLDSLFAEPVVSDQIAAQLGGLISRRLQFNSGVSASAGRVSLGEQRAQTQLAAIAGITYGLTQYLAMGADYIYYDYMFTRSANVPVGVPRATKRHGARAYLTVWAPIFHRSREAR